MRKTARKRNNRKQPLLVQSSHSRDFSNQTVLVMLLIVIIVSLFSLVVYYRALANVNANSMGTGRASAIVEQRSTSGVVGITIVDPHAINSANSNKK